MDGFFDPSYNALDLVLVPALLIAQFVLLLTEIPRSAWSWLLLPVVAAAAPGAAARFAAGAAAGSDATSAS
jgi:hypothetical protein